MADFNYTLFFGNQQEARLGPLAVTSTLTTILVSAEPLRLTDILLSGVTASPITVSLWLVPAGTTIDSSQKLLGDVNVIPNSPVTWSELNIPLNHQDELQIQSSQDGVNFFGTISRRNR